MASSERVEIGRAAGAPLVEETEREGLGVPQQAVAVARRRGWGVFAALEVRDYRLFWIGSLVSNAGSWMQIIGQGWLVLQLTNSPFWLGLASFARAVPVLLFSLPGGVVADRFDRRRLLLVTQSSAGVLAFLMAILTSLGLIQIWEIMAIVFCSALVMAIDNPARQAMVPDMVGKERLMNAIGLNSAAWNGASVVGPALAGVAIGVVGVAGCFYLNAVSYLAVVWAIWQLRAVSTGSSRRVGMLTGLVEMGRFVRRNGIVLGLFVLVAVPSLLGRPYQQLMPVFARDVLHGDARLYGILMAASGVGALLGALCTASLGQIGHKGLLLISGAALFGVTLVAFALSHRLVPSLLLLVVVGGSSTLYMGAANTLLQTTVSAQLRGRIMSVYTLILGGMMPLGGMILGSAASLTGSVALVTAAGGVIVAICALAIGLIVPGLRAID